MCVNNDKKTNNALKILHKKKSFNSNMKSGNNELKKEKQQKDNKEDKQRFSLSSYYCVSSDLMNEALENLQWSNNKKDLNNLTGFEIRAIEREIIMITQKNMSKFLEDVAYEQEHGCPY